MAHRLQEADEWVVDKVASWVETYKKSMLTPLILAIVAQTQPTTVAEIATEVARRTDWQLTERGLYRTLRRLQDTGLLSVAEVPAARTGALRKEFTLTDLGEQFRSGVTAALLSDASLGR